MKRPLSNPVPQRSFASQGSALVIVLLAILLVTSVGLALVQFTEVEMLLGSAERVITNNTYTTESGTHAALASILVTGEWGGAEFAVREGTLGSAYRMGHRIITSRVQAAGPPQIPPLTMANEGEESYYSFSVVLTSVSERVVWPAVEDSPIYEQGDPREDEVAVQARSVENVHYFLSPIRNPANPSDVYNADEITKINY